MTEATAKNATNLTIHETHFPPLVKLTAGICWGLCFIGAILEVVAH